MRGEHGGDIDVSAGVGFGGTKLMPVIRLRVQENDKAGVMVGQTGVYLSPREASMIGIDLIRAAMSSIDNTAVRLYAKEHGLDGDTMVLWMKGVAESELGLAGEDEE